jgi:two-component system response regulator FixJ
MNLTPIIRIVDDDPASRRSLRFLLQSVSLAAEEYPSAENFLRNWDPGAPGCVVLDLRMPDMSGLEIQRRLTEAGHRIPVIFLTAYGEVPTAVLAIKAGAEEFLTKPISEQALLDCIQRALKKDVDRRRRAADTGSTRNRIASLTSREREVLEGVLAGKVSREIARDLSISRKTVDMYRGRIMEKMGVDSLAALIRVCVRAEAVGGWD